MPDLHVFLFPRSRNRRRIKTIFGPIAPIEAKSHFLGSPTTKVTEANIEEFEANYRGSDYEKNDLIELYNKYKGHMNRLFCSMLCSDLKLDLHQFTDILDEAITSD